MIFTPRPLTGKAKVAGLIGWPVSHSRSPRLHGYWLAEHGIDGAYVPLPVVPEKVEMAVRGLAADLLGSVLRWSGDLAAADQVLDQEVHGDVFLLCIFYRPVTGQE